MSTLLDYKMQPKSLYYTRDSLNPSIGLLTFSAGNITDEDISSEGFTVEIPVGTDDYDPNILTATLSSVVPVSLQDGWSFKPRGEGVFAAVPSGNKKIIPAGTSITFQLKNIVVNYAKGTVQVKVMEGQNAGPVFQVQKIKSDLDCKLNALPVLTPPGQPVKLMWTSNGAEVRLTPGTYPPLPTTGETTVYPTATTTYTLTAYGEGPAVSSQITVTVPAPEISFKTSKNIVDAGETFSLSWEVTNAKNVLISHFPDKVFGLKGSIDVQIYKETSFVLTAITATNNEGPQRELSVKINPAAIVSFNNYTNGDPLLLSWETKSAAAVWIEKSSPGLLQSDVYYTIPADEMKSGHCLVTDNPKDKSTYTLVAENEVKTDRSSVDINHTKPAWRRIRLKDFPYLVLFNIDTRFLMEIVPFKGRLWNCNPITGKVHSSPDGLHWKDMNANLHYENTHYLKHLVTAFMGKLWVFCGVPDFVTGANEFKTRAWNSSDGIKWDLVTEDTGIPLTNYQRCFVIPGVDKMFIINRQADYDESIGVASSVNGKDWKSEPGFVPHAFNPIQHVRVLKNKAWLFQFETYVGQNDGKVKAYSTADGQKWDETPLKGQVPPRMDYMCALDDCAYLFAHNQQSNDAPFNMYKVDTDGNCTLLQAATWPDVSAFCPVGFRGSVFCFSGFLVKTENNNRNFALEKDVLIYTA